MKKIIVLFTSILSIFIFLTSFNKVDIEKINKINSIEGSIAFQFFIPNDNRLSDPNEMYKIIKEVSSEKNVNIFRKSVVANNKGAFEDVKYTLINTNTQFFNVFDFNEKNINTKLKDEEFYSSYNTNDPNQIGLIKDFGNNDNIKIKSFDSLYRSFSVSGVYYAELPKDLSADDFLSVLIKRINHDLDTTYTVENFKYSSQSQINNIQEPLKILDTISFMIIIVSILVITFYILQNSKKISIYKLNGISNIRIWMTIVQNHLNKSYIYASVIMIIISIINKLPYTFTLSLIFRQIIYYIIFSVFLLIPYTFILKSNLNFNIKNKDNDAYLIKFNFLVKIIFISIITSISAGILLNIKSLIKDLDNISQWEVSKDYGVIYPVLFGNNDIDDEYFDVDFSNKLYNYLNKNGALYIDAGEFQDDIEVGPEFNRHFTMTANINYLNKVNIKDEHNNNISISENETSWIVLVPEKYKSEEHKIINDIKFLREGSYNFENDDMNHKINKDEFMNQEIKIIWTKNNQNLFSFNPDVNTSNKNMVNDPIIEVITENNSLVSDKYGTWGNGGSSPLKVKLINNSTIDTYNDLLPLFKELGLDDNFTTIINLNDLILSRISELKNDIKISLTIVIMIFVCFLVIELQNIIIIFNKYKQKFIIKRSFGIGKFKAYKEFFNIFIGSYIIQILLLFVSNIGIPFDFIKITSLIYIVDLIFILVSISILESKNKIKVLKGE